jgi:uncharacterized protein DUF1016
MNPEAAHQGAAVSKPPKRTLCNASLVTVGSYATLSRNCRKRDSLTPECKTAANGSRAHQKSQTLSDKSEKLDAVDRIAAIKNPDSVWKIAQTASAQFDSANLRRRRSARSKHMSPNFTFERLIEAVRDVHEQLRAQAGRAINVSLTLRNWLIGSYIAEYELRGADRASYGENLLDELADRLTKLKVSNCNRRQLFDYLKFYRVYPQIVRTVSAQLAITPERLVSGLSYSQLKLLVEIDDDLKRAFYETE